MLVPVDLDRSRQRQVEPWQAAQALRRWNGRSKLRAASVVPTTVPWTRSTKDRSRSFDTAPFPFQGTPESAARASSA